ncbi:aldehyde dehydrogenase family protein [Lysinibacillus sp. NPDC096212]|uniref:aldehyde dehydrogenase family protein n=1 Tax=Lysinibacillus sp. NPDC096212 TaxID=3364135 RepID=UPI0037F4521A
MTKSNEIIKGDPKLRSDINSIRLANDNDYGLAGAVFSSNSNKILRVIQKVRSGITWMNAYHLTNIQAPWGGYKQSGIGRSIYTYGLDEYPETKQINMNIIPQPLHWFE